MQLNGKQIFLIIGAIVSVLMVAGPQLTDLFGSVMAKNIVSGAGLINLMINGVMVALTSNDRVVKDASNTTGVEPIRINPQANQSLAALAVDPSITNIGPAQGDYEGVEAKASGATV